MPPSRHVLALGHTGIGKTQAVKNLANYYLSTQHDLASGLDHVRAAEFLRQACLEDHIPDIHAFLDQTNEQHARRAWHDAVQAAAAELEPDREGHCILSMHGSYYRRSRAFSRTNLDEIRSVFKPTAVVVFIDDIYDAAGTIRARDARDSLRLRELATWRSIEGMIADFIAEPLQIPSYIVAVKHPVSMASQLLFGEGLRIYSAFPITRTRDNPESRAEIEQFKARLRAAEIIVFDPSTIDELLLRAALESSQAAEDPITIDLGKRWDVAAGGLLRDGRPEPWTDTACRFSRQEIEEATRDIATQVESRDFRLIQDANCLVAYRPNWGGSPSRGVTAELHLARGIGRRIFIYSPATDDPGESPFTEFGNVYRDIDEMVADLVALRQPRA